jgi:Asp-tRNA(Asn)/Glu-tRNA(Gln) amidotransferase A subunit family amidase
MQTDPAFTSALELRAAMGRKEISPVEVVTAAIARMEAYEPVLNCFVTRTPELALEAAKAAEAAILAGEDPGALGGLPISVKDLIAVGGVRLTFGSRTMAGNIAPADAPSVARVRAAGACILGKTTTPEFGCKGTGDSPLTGITRNPWDPSKTPGGSSAGAASSVAAEVTPFALCTDGGGSARIPAAMCGLVGVKAQFGRVPVFPTSAMPTMAHVGVLARTVRDAALLLTAISGHDRRDPFSVAGPVPDYLGACERSVEGMRVVWSPTLGYAEPLAEVVAVAEEAVRALQGAGCRVDVMDHVMDEDPLDLWVSEFYAGAGTRLRRHLEEEREQLDPAIAAVLDRALSQSLQEYYTKVFRRYDFRETMRTFFESIDLLVTPTVPVPAFAVGLDVPPQLPQRNVVSWQYYTYPFNLTGQPAASVPAGFTAAGLPVGLQLVAKINHETDLFRAAAALESVRPWEGRRPSAHLPSSGQTHPPQLPQ